MDDEIKQKPSKSKKPKFADKVDLGPDEDYIVVDHSNDEQSEETIEEEFDVDDYVSKLQEDEFEDVEIDNEQISQEDKVDLGSDEDYIYVDHSHDDERVLDDEEEIITEDNVINESKNPKVKSRRTNFVKSIISDVVNGESKLEKEEVETVRGEIIEDEDMPLHKPAPKDDTVVEAEIVGDEELNIFTDKFGDEDDYLEKPAPKMDYTEGDELNIFTDNFDDVLDIVDNAKKDYIDEVFDVEDTKVSDVNDDVEIPKVKVDSDTEVVDDVEIPKVKVEQDSNVNEINDLNNEINSEIPQVNEEIIENPQTTEEIPKKVNNIPTSRDGITYFQGATDVTNPLRKNNVYYKNENKNKSLRESLKGIKKDMQYINKSLNEIENPTEFDYVSVVDRTEEYNPEDYLNVTSDDDSDKIIKMEEELTFAEREEKRIEKELQNDSEKTANDVIIPVHQQFTNEELKDQALEDIIQSADEDYKQIEKQRHQKDNQFKAYDDKRLPGRGKIEDEITDYVQVTDFGLKSSDDLYKQPIESVAKSINEIVDVEGPIHIKEVTKRIKDGCNIKRAGSNLKKRVNEAITEAENAGDIIKIGDFLYDASNNNIIIRRRNKPNIELISDEEIAKNIETVLIHNPEITTKQVAKETSRNFGFKSTSKKTATRINSVLDLMIANNKVKIDNDIVELK